MLKTTKTFLLILGAGALLAGSAVGVAYARPDSAIADAERALGFGPQFCHFFQAHGHDALLCVRDDKRHDDEDHIGRSSWNLTGASVVGKHASFTLDRANGTILGFTDLGAWSDATIFSSIRLQPANASGGVLKTHGDELVWSNDAWRFVAHDVRADGFRVKAENDTVVTLVVPGDVTATLKANGTAVDLTRGAHHATLRAVDGGSIRVSGSTIDVMLPKGAALGFHLGSFPALVEKHEAREEKLEKREDKAEKRAAGVDKRETGRVEHDD